MTRHPRFGHTRGGLPVHARAVDHLPGKTRVDRFNKVLAEKITAGVGTMWCAYAFCVIALVSLPATLALHSVIADVAWVAQTFLQLVLLSVIIVGQNIQAEASDARAAKTFEDTEVIVDRLDVSTKGGLAEVLQAVRGAEDRIVAAFAAPQAPAPQPDPLSRKLRNPGEGRR